jgi:flagellar hook-associated protein 2
MPITIPGLGSGLDTNMLVDSLVSAQRRPIAALQAQQRNIDSASTTISTFSTKLAALATAARALDTTPEFNSTQATSADATAITVATAGGAQAGNFDVRVTQLAREQRTRSNSFTSNTAALGLSGTLGISVGGAAAVNVAVTSADTLNSLATKINGSGTRVSASVLYDGTRYRLMVRGMDTGSANSVAFTESPSSLRSQLGLSSSGNTYQTAANATFTVEGLSMSRPTNSVADAIPGVTLQLLKTTSSNVRITVATDGAAIRTKVNAFITAYNDVVTSGHTATGFGSQRATNPVLAGDRAIRGSLDRISRVLSSAVPGATGAYTTLGSAGIKLQNDGTLRFDEAKFNQALAADPTGVSRLFVTDPTLGATGAMGTLGAAVDGLVTATTGSVRERINSLGTMSRRLTTQIDKMEQRLDQFATALRTQFANMEGVVGRYKALLGTGIGGSDGGGTSGTV